MKYKLIKPKSRRFYLIRYVHPVTGQSKQQTTKQARKRDAERWAAEFAANIESNLVAAQDLDWQEFVTRCKEGYLARLPSRASYVSALNSFHAATHIRATHQINNAAISKYLTWAAQSQLEPTSVASYLKHLRAVFTWAESVGILARAPKITAGSTDKMRGRPLTLEEFERMLAVTSKVVGAQHAKLWRDVLRACWSIGLRRSEVLRVSWDDPERIEVLNLNGRRPMIHFPASQHKARRDDTLPLLPEAVAMLKTAARRGKQGQVFQSLRGKRRGVTTADGVGRMISEIGKRANVVTDTKDGKPIYATAHDLRRSLGTRLVEAGVPIPLVQRMMRHRSITTTMEHYVHFSPERLSAQLEGYTLGDTPVSEGTSDKFLSSVVKEL